MGAFGKDRENLKKVTSLREAGNITRGKPRGPAGGGGGGGGARFNNQFKPSATETDTIRIIPGEYLYTQVKYNKHTKQFTTEESLLPYHSYTEHYDQMTKGSTICSGGVFVDYKDKRDPCHGCDLFWEGGGKAGGRMGRRSFKVFTVYNYATFHEVEETDRDGNVKLNRTTNKPFMSWEKCQGRRCDGCAKGVPTKRGHLQHFSVGFGHFGQLKEYSKEIGKTCRSCGTKDSIREVAYLCPNCKDAVIDMDTTKFTDADIVKMIENNVDCPHCKEEVLLEEIIECTACGNAERAGIFDVDITLKKVGGSDSSVTSLMFSGHGPVAPIDPSFDAKPMDFETIFGPTPIEKQATQFKVMVPAAGMVPREPVPASQVSRPWGQGGQGQGGSGGGGGMFSR